MTNDGGSGSTPPLARLVEVLRAHRVAPFALTGGVVVGVWGTARQTHDIDLCGVLDLREVDGLLALRDGIRAGSEELPDMVRFRLGSWDVDLFVTKSPYDRECLARAIEVELDGVTLHVVTAEDLLIHKAIKLRHDRRRILQDVADIRSVVDARGNALDWEHVRRWLPENEAELLVSVATLGDEALLARLISR